MATITFYLRATTPGKISNIFLRYIDGRECDIRAIKTHYRIPPEALLRTKVGEIRIKTTFCNDEFTEQDARTIEAGIVELRSHLTKLPAGRVISKTELQSIVDKFRFPERGADVVKEPENLMQYIKRYIEHAEQGIRLTEKGGRFSKDTIKSLKSWKMNFEKFQIHRGKKINFEDVHIDLHNEIIRYFHEKNFRTNTIGKFIKALKTFMQASKDEGLHNSTEYLRKQFRAASNEVDTIYLTQAEVDAIYNLKIEDANLTLYRDVFLVGVYTAQRFSDYHRIGQGNIRKLDNGKIAISIRQKKTGTEVTIPARPELVKILARHNNNLPKALEQYVNKEIKGICRMAKITQKVEITEQIGGFTTHKTVDKCTLVTTHTARRTGATLMYLAGIPALSVMKITGHKTEKEFLKYIRLDERQTAEVISNSEYFNPVTKLKVV